MLATNGVNHFIHGTSQIARPPLVNRFIDRSQIFVSFRQCVKCAAEQIFFRFVLTSRHLSQYETLKIRW